MRAYFGYRTNRATIHELQKGAHSMTAIAERPSYSLTKLDPCDDLLALIACGLDARETFHQFSAVAARLVPHDEASLFVPTDDGSTFGIYPTTGSFKEPVGLGWSRAAHRRGCSY